MPLIETKGAASAQGFGGAGAGASGPVTYIEDVFSTYLFKGTAVFPNRNTITTGIDSSKGELVWLKNRTAANGHFLFDTARGDNNYLSTNNTLQQTFDSSGVVFTSTGFTLGAPFAPTTGDMVSWTFRKQPKFFDIVTYTGDGTYGRSIAHALGSTPGCVIVKSLSASGSWWVWHRSAGDNNDLELNSTAAALVGNTDYVRTASSTTFTVGSPVYLNGAGSIYVAYLFAHNAGGFGLSGTDNVISCGSFTTDAGGSATVTLNYEPQWLLIKRSDSTGAWYMWDIMRGLPVTASSSNRLSANTSAAEVTGAESIYPTATGFTESGQLNTNATYIYIAIRRGPMKVPTSGTSVFDPDFNASFPQPGVVTTGFVTDWDIYKRTGGSSTIGGTRLTGGNYLFLNDTLAETSGSSFLWDNNTGLTVQSLAASGNATINWAFRRAPGFFDVVCYTGTGDLTGRNHNLGVVPEWIIAKSRTSVVDWVGAFKPTASYILVYRGGFNSANLSDIGGSWASVASSTQFFPEQLRNGANTATGSTTGDAYVAYLFATCPGVSKVGSYTGTGALQTVDCGFTGGARFVLIKRTGSTGDWYVYDSARGISSGNDPYLLLNSTAAEVTGTNYVDTTSVGFQVTAAAPAGLNANGGTYIFLAIA